MICEDIELIWLHEHKETVESTRGAEFLDQHPLKKYFTPWGNY
jgi:hypothetical protein